MAIITNSDVKTYLKIDNSAHDTALTNFIAACQKRAEKYCNQPFESQSYDHFFTGIGQEYYALPYKNVTALSSLSYRTVPTDSFTVVDVANTALFQERSVHLLYYSSGFAWGTFFKATITAGYSPLSIPDDLQQIVTEMVAIMYKESTLSGDGLLGIDTESTGFAGESVTKRFTDLWEKRWKGMLNPYRVPTV